MKQFAFIAAATVALGVSSPTLSAQAFSNPTGYVTETLKAGQFNLIGLTVHQPVDVAGTFDSVSGTTLTMAGAFGELDSEATYVLEITSGLAEGAIQEITAWTNSTITSPDDLSSILTSSDTFVLRRASTLTDIFGANNEVGLQEGSSVTTSDVIYIPNSAGSFDQFFYSSGGFFGIGWRQDGQGAVDMSDQTLFQTDAFYILRRGAEMDLVVSGAVKTSSTNVALANEFTYLSGVYPVGSTLGSSGLENSLEQGSSETVADTIYIPNGNSFDIYFYSDGGFFGIGWRLAGGGSVDQSDVEIPSGIVIRRVSDVPSSANINVPAGWSL